MTESLEIKEFLYFCPDTGMTICMIQDGASFRPATALDERMSIVESYFDKQPASTFALDISDDYESLDTFVSSYVQAFLPG